MSGVAGVLGVVAEIRGQCPGQSLSSPLHTPNPRCPEVQGPLAGSLSWALSTLLALLIFSFFFFFGGGGGVRGLGLGLGGPP